MVQTRAAPPPVRGTVPGRIWVISGVTTASLALLFVALAVGSATARDGLRLIGRDAGPQIVATTGLYLALSDMDAQVAGALVMGEPYPAQRRDALARYERRRAEAHQALLKAFELSGDNLAERRTVQSVLDGLGEYEQLAARALLLDEQSRHAPGPPPRDVVRTYRAATDLMRLVLLPQAYNLALENGTIVRHTYDDKSFAVPLLRAAVVVTGLVALACLIWLQVYLAGRFRRVFGPALLTATAVTAAALFLGGHALGQSQLALREAKSLGFDRVMTLVRARAISYSLPGDQSRYLLDTQRADTYEHTFLDKSRSIVYVEAADLDAYQAKVIQDSGGFLGLLGSELIGRPGQDAKRAYANFHNADSTFRDLAAAGRTREAVEVRLGSIVSWFEAYDQALVRLTERHQSGFESAIRRGEDALDDLWRLLPYEIGAIGLLMVAGVWPRLREYR